MGHLEMDLDLSAEAVAMQETARKFGMEVVRPAGIELDRLPGPAEVIAEGSGLRNVHGKYREIGFHRTALPGALGGTLEEMDPKAGALIAEALGYADAGLALSLSLSTVPFKLAALSSQAELREWTRAYCESTDGRIMGGWGSASAVDGTGRAGRASHRPFAAGWTCCLEVEPRGDEYVQNGRRTIWVSNGSIATHVLVEVREGPQTKPHCAGVALLPMDLAGVSRGKPMDGMGQRSLNRGEIVFENVRIPERYMVFQDAEHASAAVKELAAAVNGEKALVLVGLAEAAFDAARDYARERIQGGKSILEHENVRLKLFDMFTGIESARALARRVSAYHDASGSVKPVRHALAARVLAAETAFKVASEAVQIFGGNGLSMEYPIEKLLRDARASMVEDASQEVLAAVMGEDP